MTKKEVNNKESELEFLSKVKEENKAEVHGFEGADQNEILSYLKRSEKLSKEMLKTLRFIKKYYFWRSLFNGFKIAIVILVIILGIVTWDNITEFFTAYSTGNMERGFSNAIKDGLGKNFNF